MAHKVIKYDFDLNPRFGAIGERRWIVRRHVEHEGLGRDIEVVRQYASKQGAQFRSEALNYALKHKDWTVSIPSTRKTPAMSKFEAVIWEKAEHWTFDVSIIAKDETSAIKELKRMYPPRSYSIRSILRVWNG